MRQFRDGNCVWGFCRRMVIFRAISSVGFARKPPVYLKDGDVLDVEIEGLGVLSNLVSG